MQGPFPEASDIFRPLRKRQEPSVQTLAALPRKEAPVLKGSHAGSIVFPSGERKMPNRKLRVVSGAACGFIAGVLGVAAPN